MRVSFADKVITRASSLALAIGIKMGTVKMNGEREREKMSLRVKKLMTQLVGEIRGPSFLFEGERASGP